MYLVGIPHQLFARWDLALFAACRIVLPWGEHVLQRRLQPAVYPARRRDGVLVHHSICTRCIG